MSDGIPSLSSPSSPAVARGDMITLRLDGLSGEGTSVGRYMGKVCFIEGAVPGDEVRVRIVKAKSQYLMGKTEEVLTPSGLRVVPKCVHFGECGGCRWQNLDYGSQLEFKRDRIREAFRRIALVEEIEVRPVIGSEQRYYYRNKMEFTFSDKPWLSAGLYNAEDEVRKLSLGLHVTGRYDHVVDLSECHLQSESSAAILNSTRKYFLERGEEAYSTRTHAGYLRHLVVREGKRTGQTMVNLVTSADRPELMASYADHLTARHPEVTTVVNNVTARQSMVARGEFERIVWGPGAIAEQLGAYSFRISANSFFQTNTAQAQALYNTIVELTGFRADDAVYDLYCGTGAISIFVSGHVGRVVGIESVPEAVADAVHNAEVNAVKNCSFVCGELPGSLDTDRLAALGHPQPSVVIVDPPRSGLHAKLIAKVVESGPRAVVYVSCNPVTQARDVRLFIDGGYTPGQVQPVDMFPHTDHVETVVVLRR